jgi:hypothetical protein
VAGNRLPDEVCASLRVICAFTKFLREAFALGRSKMFGYVPHHMTLSSIERMDVQTVLAIPSDNSARRLSAV